MEEMKENEIKEKKNKWWKVLPISLVIIFAVCFGLIFLLNQASDNGISTTTTTLQATTITEMYTATGNNVFDKEVSSSEIVKLNAGRYSLSFNSNNAVVISLGKNPNGFLVCCNINEPKASGTQNFDINSGSEGDYLLKIDGDSQLSHVTISQSLAF